MMEREEKLILDTTSKVLEIQRLMMDVQHDHTQKIKELRHQVEHNKSILKEYQANNYEWKE